MNQTPHPSKEMVREWLKNQIGQHRPPPSPGQIRQQLGWEIAVLPGAAIAPHTDLKAR